MPNTTPCYKSIIYGPSADLSNPDSALNVIFPTTGKHKISSKAVYAEDNVNIKYYENTLTINAIIYYDLAVLDDVEAEADRIRNILTTPRLMLKMYPTGVGYKGTINGRTPANGDITDVGAGPLPILVSVEPVVTNAAISIEWSVIFYTPECLMTFPYFENLPRILSFSSSLDVNVDENGIFSFTKDWIINFASPVQATNTVVSALNFLIRDSWTAPNHGGTFIGLKKDIKTKLSRDYRSVQLVVTYSDPGTDSPLFPYIVNADASDEMSSSRTGSAGKYGKGFVLWNRKISATYTVPPGVHKAWAWLAFKQLLKDRFRNLKVLGAAKKIINPDVPNNAKNDDATSKNWYLLLSIKIKNSIYSRSIYFEFDYVVTTELATLWSRSLMLARANSNAKYENDKIILKTTPQTFTDQWAAWEQSMLDSKAQKLGGRYADTLTSALKPSPTCVGTTTDSQSLTKTESVDFEVDPDATVNTATMDSIGNNTPDDSEIDPRYSWMDFKNNIKIIQKNDSFQSSFLQPVQDNYYKAGNVSTSDGGGTSTSSPGRGAVGWRIDNVNSPGESPDAGRTRAYPTVVKRGIATYIIQLTGYALRAGYGIPVPDLLTVNNIPIDKVGNAVYTQNQVAIADKVPIYLAMWSQNYAVTTDLRSDDILSKLQVSLDASVVM